MGNQWDPAFLFEACSDCYLGGVDCDTGLGPRVQVAKQRDIGQHSFRDPLTLPVLPSLPQGWTRVVVLVLDVVTFFIGDGVDLSLIHI